MNSDIQSFELALLVLNLDKNIFTKMRKDELTDIPFPISKTEAIEYNNNRLFEMHDPNSEIRKHILQFAIELAAIEKEKEMINNNSQLSPTTTTIIEERIRINKNVIEIN